MTYDDLINDIVPDCPGVPVPVAIRAIREAVRQFCRKSSVYRQKLTAADLTYADGVYTIAIPANTQIISVVSPLVIDGTDNANPSKAFGASSEWLDINRHGWRSAETCDWAEHFVMLSTNTFALVPDSGSDRSDDMAVTLILMPDRTTTTLDDDLGERWFDELTAGAKYLLMVMPEKPWSNTNLAKFYYDKFTTGLDAARRYIETGYRQPQKASGIKHVRGYYK